MALEVDFVTLGDASERLDMPSATLRHWTDQLEEFNTHFVLRNNRNERIYYDEDLKIFKFLKDLKKEYGRRTTTEDLCYMLIDKAEEGVFELRKREDAPLPSNPSNRTADLLGQEDIKRLMESERVKQFMSIVADNVRDGLKKEFQEQFDGTNQKILESYKLIEQKQKERDEEWMKRMDDRFNQTNEYIAELRAKRQKPWWKRVFSE